MKLGEEKEKKGKQTSIIRIRRQEKTPREIGAEIELLHAVVQVGWSGEFFAAEDGVVESCA